MASTTTRNVRVFRYDPSVGGDGDFQTYRAGRSRRSRGDDARRAAAHPARAGPDDRVSLRLPRRDVRLVRHGRSTARSGWRARRTSRTSRRAQDITLRPMNHFPVIKDLVVDMDPMFQQVPRDAVVLRAEGRVDRAGADPARCAGARGDPHRDRLHRVRVLRVELHDGGSSPRLRRPGGAGAGVLADRRRSRRAVPGAARGGAAVVSRVPDGDELHGGLSEGDQPDAGDQVHPARRRSSAARRSRRSRSPDGRIAGARRRSRGEDRSRDVPASRGRRRCSARRRR